MVSSSILSSSSLCKRVLFFNCHNVYFLIWEAHDERSYDVKSNALGEDSSPPIEVFRDPKLFRISCERSEQIAHDNANHSQRLRIGNPLSNHTFWRKRINPNRLVSNIEGIGDTLDDSCSE